MSFFNKRYAQLYDTIYQDKPYASESRFVFDTLARFAGQSPQRLLELACGTGNHAIELAKLGVHVTGVDISEDLLKVAREKASQRNVANVEFLRGDMTELALPSGGFDAAVCMFDSIGYVQSDDRIKQVLQGVHQALRPDGLFLFEFWHADAMLRHFESQRFRKIATQTGEILRLSETVLRPESSLADVKFDLYELDRNGGYFHMSETHTNRYFSVAQMEAFASITGFRVLAAYSGFDSTSPIDDTSWHIISVWQAANK